MFGMLFALSLQYVAVVAVVSTASAIAIPFAVVEPLLDTFDTCDYFLQVFALLTSLQRVYQLSIIRLHGCCWEISFILVCLPRFFSTLCFAFAFALVPCQILSKAEIG